MRAAGSVWIRRLGISALVAVALGYVPYHLYGSSGLARLVKLERERDALHEANLKTHEANLKLRAELSALGDSDGDEAGGEGEGRGAGLSPSAVERAARDELGLVKPGEIVFQVDEAPGARR
jgi:cell division protein FtsB